MTQTRFPWHFVAAMAIVVVASNLLVEAYITDWLVWASLTYPVAFLVTDLTNRFHGASTARKVIYVGFALGVGMSFWLGEWRIALASGSAFLIAQLLDVAVFNRLRQHVWWVAPLLSSALSTFIDNGLFWSLAFLGTDVPWVTLGTTDLLVKWGVALLALIPYGLLARRAGRSNQEAVS